MGSGLILLVIVGAWLAVLVPMALRSHDASSSRSTERFGDAMRVLSPRSARRPAEGATEPPPELEPLLRSMREVEPRPPVTLVQRRRRVLLGLLGAALACLLGALLTGWLLLPAGVLLALAVAYVVHLRRLTLHRAERSVREAFATPRRTPREASLQAARPARPASRPAAAHLGLPGLPGLPTTMPARPAPPVASPAARYEEPLPAAVGAEWSPVPVPPPVYASKPVAPPREPRTIDLTEPGRWAATVTADQLGEEPDLELDDILDGRRVVGGW